jgi:hypothetical protein
VNPVRYAIVKDVAAATVERYLPGNYMMVCLDDDVTKVHEVLIVGRDLAGWTMDDYVIPRLASGLIFAKEIVPKERPNDS